MAAHTDGTIKRPIHQRAAVETVCDQLLRRLALRATIRQMTTGIGNLFRVLLDPAKGIGFAPRRRNLWVTDTLQ